MNLVTGATGLVGSHLVFRLAQMGESVLALYRGEQGLQETKDFFQRSGNSELFHKITWVQGDVTDLEILEDVAPSVRRVFHTAALVSYHKKDAKELYRINVEGTKNLVNVSIDFGIEHFIHISSIAALGDSPKDIITEDTERDVNAHHSNYSESKYLGELEVWRGIQEDLPATILNPGIIFGPANWRRSSGNMLARIAAGLPALPAGGTGIVSVFDVVEAAVNLGLKPATNERYILVEENISDAELFTFIANELHVKIGKRIAPKYLLVGLYLMEALKELFTGKRASITREILRNYSSFKKYDGNKITKGTGFSYSGVRKAIQSAIAYQK